MILHALSHWLGLTGGLHVVSAADRHNNLWMALRCPHCGRVSHKALNSFCHPEPSDGDFKP